MSLLNRDNTSYLILLLVSLLSLLHLSWMTYYGKFTFSLIGMMFIVLNTLNSYVEYLPMDEEKQDYEPPVSHNERETENTYDFDSYRPQIRRPRNRYNANIQREAVARAHTKTDSTITTILQFCANVLTTSFFTTDLFFAYQVFEPDLNYLPLLGGVLNIIPAIYVSDSVRQREFFVYTVPANCWGQVYLVGIKMPNYYAALAGYLFFMAYYYVHVQRSNFGIMPEAYANYYLIVYCALSSLALEQAFVKFDMQL